MELPDFGLGTSPGGLVSPYSDGTPRISFALVDAAGTVLLADDAERVYYSASTVKVGVMIAALRLVQSGEWSLEDEWRVHHDFASIVPEAGRFTMPLDDTDAGLGKPGDTVALRHVLERMIIVSANCATNMLFEALGPERVRAVSVDAGVSDTFMGRPYSDEAGLEAGVTNAASALGLARLVAALLRGDLLDAEHTAIARDLLRRRSDPEISTVAKHLAERNGVAIDTGGKGGSVEAIEHDVAFVEAGGTLVCLAVCTNGFTGEQALTAIRALAAAALPPVFGWRS